MDCGNLVQGGISMVHVLDEYPFSIERHMSIAARAMARVGYVSPPSLQMVHNENYGRCGVLGARGIV